ncbi:MAG TPA: Na+ dependent nucleoside transporter, partial [Salinimicrobium catena]|nr:Na+ dependent nucleoside transporter [Salinimicrobium catena]
MNKFWCCLFLIFFGISSTHAQTIAKTWNFEAVEDSTQQEIFDVNPGTDFLKLENGTFEFSLKGEKLNKASGNYVFQNDVLVLFYDSPHDSIQNLRVQSLTDSTLTLLGKNVHYSLREQPQEVADVLPVETKKEM